MEQTKKMYKKSDKNATMAAYKAKNPYKQTNKQLWALKERRSKINTNTWLATLLAERTNEKGTRLILINRRQTKYKRIGIENFSTCSCETQPDCAR